MLAQDGHIDAVLLLCAVKGHAWEQPGEKAPGTPKRIPVLLPNTFVKVVFVSGVPSKRVTSGRLSPACAREGISKMVSYIWWIWVSIT